MYLEAGFGGPKVCRVLFILDIKSKFLCSYLHTNGFIHRDIKAANLLIDDDGTVLLGDLGVAASLSDEEAIHPHSASSKPRANFNSTVESPHIKSHPPHRIGKRKSFVGTVRNKNMLTASNY